MASRISHARFVVRTCYAGVRTGTSRKPRARAASQTFSPLPASWRSCGPVTGRAGIRARTESYAASQPCGFTFRSVDAGYFASWSAGRTGRRTSSPPQFGQRPFRTRSAQSLQNVHSNEHIMASRVSGGRSRSQHSQLGRSASIVLSFQRGLDGFNGTDFLRGLDDARLARIDVRERGRQFVENVERHHDRAVLVRVDEIAAVHLHAVNRHRNAELLDM